MAYPKVLAFILAGGKGERLFPLTAMRSKPSVPFGGRYRIVDFVLSNFINSHIYSNYLLVQYKSQSLIEHIRENWVLSPVIPNQFVAVVPPQMRTGPEWFQGTADAVFQNINLIRQHKPELVIIFGADHIYRMDLRQMIDFHLEMNSYVTVAARPVALKEASDFGVIAIDGDNRIVEFQEKPKNPTPMPFDPKRAYVSMGNYLFNTEVLLESLVKMKSKSQHDFGAHMLPSLIDTKRLFAYDFTTGTVPGSKDYEEVGYWRDVGSIEAYFNAHMDMLGAKPRFELNNPQWPIFSGGHEGPSTKFIKGDIRNSLIAGSGTIHRAKIKNSIIRSNVEIEDGAVIEDSIIMDNVVIRKNAKLRRVIIDKLNIIEEGEEIGFDPAKDRFRCHLDPSGICIVPRGGRKTRL